MKQHDTFDDFLKDALREKQTYLPDEGFTAGVMAKLPAVSASKSREWLIIGSVCLLTSLVVLAQLPLGALVQQIWQWSSALDFGGLVRAGATASGVIFIVSATWLARQMRLV